MASAAAQSLFRQGLISGEQWGKLSRQGKKKEPARMADFDDKGGTRDQGGTKDRGHAIGARKHIDVNQEMGSPARASGKPSKGGSVHGAQKQPVKRGELDAAPSQKPDFPGGSRMKAGNAKRKLSRQTGRIPAQGGQYGGGGRDTQ